MSARDNIAKLIDTHYWAGMAKNLGQYRSESTCICGWTYVKDGHNAEALWPAAAMSQHIADLICADLDAEAHAQAAPATPAHRDAAETAAFALYRHEHPEAVAEAFAAVGQPIRDAFLEKVALVSQVTRAADQATINAQRDQRDRDLGEVYQRNETIRALNAQLVAVRASLGQAIEAAA